MGSITTSTAMVSVPRALGQLRWESGVHPPPHHHHTQVHRILFSIETVLFTFALQVLDSKSTDLGGIKSATAMISGPGAFGQLRRESGTVPPLLSRICQHD
jgi:protein subunit release factor A